MQELAFEITQEADGSYSAEAPVEGIFAQGNTWGELLRNVSDAIEAHNFDAAVTLRVRLGLMKDRIQLLPGWDAPIDLLCEGPESSGMSYPVK